MDIFWKNCGFIYSKTRSISRGLVSCVSGQIPLPAQPVYRLWIGGDRILFLKCRNPPPPLSHQKRRSLNARFPSFAPSGSAAIPTNNTRRHLYSQFSVKISQNILSHSLEPGSAESATRHTFSPPWQCVSKAGF